MASVLSGARLALGLALLGAVSLPVLAQETPKRGGALQVIVAPEPPGLMEGITQNGPTQMIAGNIYESLLRYDEKLNPLPSLAKSWEKSADEKRSDPEGSGVGKAFAFPFATHFESGGCVLS